MQKFRTQTWWPSQWATALMLPATPATRVALLAALLLSMLAIVPGIVLLARGSLYCSVTHSTLRLLASAPMLKIVDNDPIFHYVAVALHITLDDLGYANQVVRTIDVNDTSSIYIVTSAAHWQGPLPPQYIAYNFEQLTTNKKWEPGVFTRFRGAVVVWDYSLENINELHKHGIHAMHVPLGYAATMESSTTPMASQRDIDIFFVGSINKRRDLILQPLEKQRVWNVDFTKGRSVLGEQLQAMYGRAKMGINLHYYEGRTILEVHRIIPYIVNNIWVLSEHSNDTWLDSMFADIVDFVEPHELTARCTDVLSYRATEFQAEVERRHERLVACCSFGMFLAPAVKQLALDP